MLGNFQKTAVIVALVILILGLTTVAVMLVMSARDEKWPPYSGSCPDYWSLSKDGTKCKNINNIGKGTGKCNTLRPASGEGSGCYNYNWAKQCHVTWDGITNSDTLKDTC
jgi:hypothetical protein